MTNTLGVLLLLTKTLHGFVTADTSVVAVLLRDFLGVLNIFVCLLHTLLLQFLKGFIMDKRGVVRSERGDTRRVALRVGKKIETSIIFFCS